MVERYPRFFFHKNVCPGTGEKSLYALCNLVNKTLGIFPSKTGICNGFSVAVFPYLLIAFFNIAFNHNALDKGIQISRVAAAVKHFFYNADLLLVLLVGVGVVSVYNAGRIYQIPFHVKLMKQHQILVVVVGQALAMFADSTPQDGVCQGLPSVFTSQSRIINSWPCWAA